MNKTKETTTGAGPTAGPWRAVAPTVERRKDVFASVRTNSDGAHGFPTCEFEIMADGYKNSEAAANARLIAASPALLAALSNAAHRIGQLSLMAKQAREILARETVTQAELRDARGFLLSIEQEKTEEYDAIIAGAEGGAA